MNKAQIIDAIMSKAVLAENAVKDNRYVQAMGQDMQGFGENIKKLIASEAARRALGAEARQRSAQGGNAYRQIRDGNVDAMKAIGETLNMNPNTVESVLSNIPRQGAVDVSRKFQEKVSVPDNTLVGTYRRANEWIAKNPGQAIAAGVPAAGAGGLALITASGQALADLGNFLAGGQQNQGQRDNVLRS